MELQIQQLDMMLWERVYHTQSVTVVTPFVADLLQGAHRLLLKTTNIKMGVRLGLLNQDHSKALIFEVDSAKMKGEN